MDEKQLYQAIAEEIAANRMDPARWTQAFAEADGDREKARAIYIRLRRADLASGAAAVADAGPLDPLAALRREMRQALEGSQRPNLYRRLGLSADAADEEVAAAVRRLGSAGEGSDAEVRYAIEILADPVARARYDRSLAAEMGIGPNARRDRGLDVFEEPGPQSVFLSWWSSRKVSLLLAAAVVGLLGTMWLPYYQTDTMREHLRAQAEIEQQRLRQAEQREEAQAERQRLAEEQRAEMRAERLASQQRAEQERFAREAHAEQLRLESARNAEERRQAREAKQQLYARQKLQREAQEQARLADAHAEREAEYWNCFNDAMDRGDSAYAHAKCRRLRN